jgi:pimeloyl-ACP methyl ester carboxylesterase
MHTVSVEPVSPSGLPSLVLTPEACGADAPVLVFLHGKGEAGASPGELPMVCVHETPPWQAIAGRLPGTIVVAPQAPPAPSRDEWNWRDHVRPLAAFIRERFPNRRVVGTGFSRGGLGVLQMLVQDPAMFDRWAIVDPQPSGDAQEQTAILSGPTFGRGWLRYGVYRQRSAAWTQFASALEERIPQANRDVTQLGHGEMAFRAYSGDRLSSSDRQNLYDFLGVRF